MERNYLEILSSTWMRIWKWEIGAGSKGFEHGTGVNENLQPKNVTQVTNSTLEARFLVFLANETIHPVQTILKPL